MKIFISVLGALILAVTIQDIVQLPPPLFSGMAIGFFVLIMLLLNFIFKKKKEPEQHYHIQMIFPTDQKNKGKFAEFYKDELGHEDYLGDIVDEVELEHRIVDNTVLAKLEEEWLEIGYVNDGDLVHLNGPAAVTLYFSKDTGFFFRCYTPLEQ